MSGNGENGQDNRLEYNRAKIDEHAAYLQDVISEPSSKPKMRRLKAAEKMSPEELVKAQEAYRKFEAALTAYNARGGEFDETAKKKYETLLRIGKKFLEYEVVESELSEQEPVAGAESEPVYEETPAARDEITFMEREENEESVYGEDEMEAFQFMKDAYEVAPVEKTPLERIAEMRERLNKSSDEISRRYDAIIAQTKQCIDVCHDIKDDMEYYANDLKDTMTFVFETERLLDQFWVDRAVFAAERGCNAADIVLKYASEQNI